MYMYVSILVYDQKELESYVQFNIVFIFFLFLHFQVTDKFYWLTNIRYNITSTYHPQANGEVETFNRATQEAFLKCQEFHDEVIKADTQWHKKLHSILFTYRTRKHASTKISPYMIMYGRECVMPWELEGDLGPLEDKEDQDLTAYTNTKHSKSPKHLVVSNTCQPIINQYFNEIMLNN